VVEVVQTPDWRLAVVFNRHSFHELGCNSDWGGFLIWWTVEHHLSRWQFLGILLLVSLPYTVLESWAKRRVKLIYLRKQQKASA
jgi:hypothetical protein